MTTLVLQAAGGALGTALGGPIGAIAGRVVGSVAGAALDGALFGGGTTRAVEGPRLTDVAGIGSTEGAPIPRVYGRARIGGEVIWATRLEEVATTSVERGSAAAKATPRTTTTVRTTYAYFANVAVGLCEGPIALVRRVWADGRELDLTALTMRVHVGAEDQGPDPLIVAKEGADAAPAYRGLAYVVFERLALADFGNRVPQFTFEVVRPVAGLARAIRAVCLIPGASEFGLDPAPVTEDLGLGTTRPANRFQLGRATDVLASLDALQALCPNVRAVAVVASWFGDDLRAGHCALRPGVERIDKTTTGDVWSVAGLPRAAARVVSRTPDGRSAYGGTPSDAGLGRLVAELRARGLAVVLYPFVMMDVPAGNALPNPGAPGTPGQPPYPWRGRITCDPAPEAPGSVDATPEAAAQVAAFFGAATALDAAAGVGTSLDWRFRHLVLHYAALAAGWGLDGFILGSELVGLTRVRGPGADYPAVAALRALAADVRGVLGAGVPIVYAADWTEYGAHVLDGGAELRFPLDPLFADPAIAAVGIDFYPPIGDWRDGPGHADLDEAWSPYDPDYLRRRVGSGEAFDWYYPSESARALQERRPITDGACGEPWVFRAKDLVGWWSNPHRERVGGVELPGPTAWRPGMKPIWLTEIGVPAVDKGPNGPNVFPDPKSSEGRAPPFSRGGRDERAQVAGLEAILSRFDPAMPGHEAGDNPSSPSNGAPMVDPSRVFVWCWDARPFPAFPDLDAVWGDAVNWAGGHWITGRIEGAPLARVIAAILADLDLPAATSMPLGGFLDGYVIDRPMSGREALAPLVGAFGVEATASAGRLAFRDPDGDPGALAIPPDALVAPDGEGPLITLARAQESELPVAILLDFTDGESAEYRRSTVGSRRVSGASRREQRVSAAIVTRRGVARGLADDRLQGAWSARETARFALSPRALALEPGDLVRLPNGATHRVTGITDEPGARRVETRAASLDARVVARAPAGPASTPLGAGVGAEAAPAPPSWLAALPPAPTPAPTFLPAMDPRPAAGSRPAAPIVHGPPLPIVLDLPGVPLGADRDGAAGLQHLAVAADPWPGAAALYRAAGEGAPFALHRLVDWPALVGRTLDPVPPGPVWRWDEATAFRVELAGGTLASIDDASALAGGNLFALRGGDGAVEILSAARAEFVGPRTYRLSRLLRGLAGSEARAGTGLGPGALLVRLDDAVVPLVAGLDEVGRAWRYRLGPAGRDPSDPAFAAFGATAGLTALRPFAPVHVAARREAAGVAVTWIRRARIDGDAWGALEVPLGEEAERYEVDVLDEAGLVRRTLEADGPSALYPAALEAIDFGGPRPSVILDVYQVSAVAGRGFPRRAALRLD